MPRNDVTLLGGKTMNFELTDEQIAIRDTVRKFAEKEVWPRAEELDIKNGKVFRKDMPDKTYNFDEIFNGWSSEISLCFISP